MKNLERRSFPFEIRVATQKKARTVTGYGAIYNSLSLDLGGFREVIHPGAFEEALSRSDVRALVNHEPSKILGKLSAGTLRLSIDDKGLQYEFELPDTTYGRDLAVSLDRGDISQSSFAFTVAVDDFEDTPSGVVRHIRKIDELFDISPVTYPAYESTDARVAIRSLAQFQNRQKVTASIRRRELLSCFSSITKSTK